MSNQSESEYEIETQGEGIAASIEVEVCPGGELEESDRAKDVISWTKADAGYEFKRESSTAEGKVIIKTTDDLVLHAFEDAREFPFLVYSNSADRDRALSIRISAGASVALEKVDKLQDAEPGGNCIPKTKICTKGSVRYRLEGGKRRKINKNQ